MTRFLFAIILFSFNLAADCQTVDFTFATGNGLFCSPASVTFTQACTGDPKSFIWDFGNGTYGDQSVQNVTYTSAGNYTVKLIAIFDNTTLSISKTITINAAVNISITADKSYICQPGTINFTAAGSGNISNYEWNFGDGSPVISTPANTVSHSFTTYKTDSVTLKATDVSGCTGTAVTTIKLQKLAINGTVSRHNGCIPATVNFVANATLPAGSSVTSYTWDFGDGSPLVATTINSTTHNYPAAGQYFSTVTVISSEGCTSIYSFTRLYFGTPPTNLNTYVQKSPLCASDSAVFIATATNANRYFWNFADGTTASTTDTIIKHKYNTVGVKAVRVVPYYNECTISSFPSPITIIGVVAKYFLFNTCTNRDTYSFADTSSGISTGSVWNFGDGTPIETNVANTVHTYPSAGQFTATLTLSDSISGCRDSISKIIYTATPSVFTADSVVCKNALVSFSVLNGYINDSAKYTWNVLGTQYGASPQNITVPANFHGNFNSSVIINNGIGTCPDTVQLNRLITVKGPDVNFTAPASVCLGTDLSVTNNSKPFVAADSINTWIWNFGNGFADSIFQPLSYTYAGAGSYNIKLSATDINGCVDSLVKTVTVNPMPFLHIAAATDTLCYGLSDTLIAFHNNAILWSPAANLSCTACDTTVASPVTSTKYYATATNTFNCSVQDSISILVGVPFTASISPAAAFICKQQTATVDVNPKGKIIAWFPTAGLSDASTYNPVISPLETTVYTVFLSDSLGCSNDSVSVIINVKSSPTVDAGPDAFYPNGAGFTFAPTYSSNVSSYLWSPAQLLTCSTCAVPSGVAKDAQTYIIQVTSDSGCVAKDSVTISVECKYSNLFMPKSFTPNNDNLNDVFYPMAIGIKSITKFIIYDRRGQVIFQANNFSPNDRNFGWDGRFKGAEQSVGTYVYILEAMCDLGEKLFKKDSFILLR